MTHGSIVRQLVWKDVQLHRAQLVFTILCGVAALTLLLWRQEPTTVVGSVTCFIALIFTSAMLPGTSVLNERKRQTLPFLMSLPMSSMQYTTAKLIGTVGMFAIPWSTIALAAIWLISFKHVLPAGAIPMAIILLALPFIGLCLNIAMTLVGETEGWSIASNVLCNSSYGLVWYFITRTPSLMKDLKSPTPVWNSAVVTFLSCEFGFIALVLAITYFLQSRKRDFI